MINIFTVNVNSDSKRITYDRIFVSMYMLHASMQQEFTISQVAYIHSRQKDGTFIV